MDKISVVINASNEEENLARAIASVKGLADEIVVVDMESTDRTIEVAKKLGAKVFSHKKMDCVEPARNFGISKVADGEQSRTNWILILDPDEEVGPKLVKKLKEIVKSADRRTEADYYRLPRKNVIFNKWIKHSRWWPDYNIRFFKKGFVSWNETIHSVPMTQGNGADLPDKEEFAIIHHNYRTIEDYLERMNRYTRIQAEELLKNGYVFAWQDLLKKPLSEFLGRFFAGQGFKDGVHGLALAALQAFSELVLYLKVWQKQGFREQETNKGEIKNLFRKSFKEIDWWIRKEFSWLRFFKL